MADYSNERIFLNRCALDGVKAWIASPVNYEMRSVAAPILYVYPDQTIHEPDQVAAYLHENQIEQYLCSEFGIAVVFAPANEQWGPDDVKSYMAVTQNFTDNSDVEVEEGIVQGYASGVFVRFDPHPEGKYSGSTGRLYIIAEGKGADFAARCLISDDLSIPTPWGALIQQDPTGFVLFNGQNPAGCGHTPVVAALFSCGSELRESMKVLNQADRGDGDVAFNSANTAQRILIRSADSLKEAVEKGLKFVSGVHRYSLGRTSNRLLEIPNFEECGIKAERHFEEISTGLIEYIEYVPEQVKTMGAGSAPLLILLHGGGSSAEFIAWVSEYPIIGKEDNLIVLSINHHVKKNSDEILELADQYIRQHPVVNKARIYVSGFSMGSVKTQEFALKHSHRIAAVSPQSGSSGFGGVGEGEMVPVYYVGGEESPLPELPKPEGQENDINQMVVNMCRMNRVPLSPERKDPGSKYGYRPDAVTLIRSKDGLNTITQECFISEDGVMRTILSSASNMTHCTLKCNCEEAWKFMREFTRSDV